MGDTNSPPWWCPTCDREVFGRDVTYEERHYEETGGCGCPVVPKEDSRVLVLEARVEELERGFVALVDSLPLSLIPEDRLATFGDAVSVVRRLRGKLKRLDQERGSQ